LERGSHTIDTPALFMCVCWASYVCVLLRIQDTRPLTGKITTDSSCGHRYDYGYMAMDRHEREKQRAVSVSQSNPQLSFSFGLNFCALANIQHCNDCGHTIVKSAPCDLGRGGGTGFPRLPGGTSTTMSSGSAHASLFC